MKEKTIYVEYNNKKYPLVFNLNVMEEIQNVYGDIEKWGEIVENNHNEPKIKDLKFGLMVMINEGLDIENETNEIKRELSDISCNPSSHCEFCSELFYEMKIYYIKCEYLDKIFINEVHRKPNTLPACPFVTLLNDVNTLKLK